MALVLNAKTYTNYEEFLQDENIDLVYIATPPFLHYQQSKLALLAGKHVICEKPLAMTLEEADEMIDVCKRQDVLLAYAEELLFTPKYLTR